MKSLLVLFTKLWFISLLGMLALDLIVWIEGPLLSFNGHPPLETMAARGYLILILMLVWGGWLLWRSWRARRANAEMLKAMGAADPPAAAADPLALQSAEDLRSMMQRFEEALEVLRKAKLGGRFGQQYLYQLPWYMFVGAPGAGKTTALVNSGLKFPLSDQFGPGALRGVGGTRDCDWWFTDEAVLLDTAGRYTTQDSQQEVDRAAWTGFLDLLKTYRPRRPVNGIILGISVAELLQQDEAARKAQAAKIRARIQELYTQLGVRFPIYVLVTKLDLLAGFMQFFDHFGEQERTQVWGFSFVVDPEGKIAEDPLAGYATEFAALEARLNGRLLERLQQERDPVRRALVYGFPQQFTALKPVLQAFLADALTATRYEQKPWVRGVYFTSGTQEGSPIDRVMGSLAAAFGLKRQAVPLHAGSGRSYFLTRLLSDVIFQESGLTGTNPKVERRRRWLQRGAYLAAAVVLVVALIVLSISYGRNQGYVAEVAAKTEQARALAAALTPRQAGVLDAVPLLDSLLAIPGGYRDRDQGTPWLMGFGLYQGDKLGSEAQDQYRRLLNVALLPRVRSRLEQQLRAADSNSPDLLYEGLRVYLMLGDKTHFDPEAIAAWCAFDSERNLAREASAEQRKALTGHIAAMLDRAYFDFGQPLSQELVDEVRHKLARVPLAQRVYSRLSRTFARAGLNDFSVLSAAGRDAPTVLVRRSGESLSKGVGGLYTVAGYRQFLVRSAGAANDLAGETWVLGQEEALSDAGAVEKLIADVRQLYFEDYIRRWDTFLGDLGVVSFTNPEQGGRMIALLAGADSPLRKFLQGAARETTLASVEPKKTVVDAVKGRLEDFTKRLESAVDGGTDAPALPGSPNTTPVDTHFEALHRYVDAGGTPGNAPLDRSLNVLNDVKAFLEAAASARTQGLPPPRPEAIDKLGSEAKSAPAAVGQGLQDIAKSASASTLGGERQRLNALWVATVAPYCQQAIAGRYPIFPKGSEEVPQEDFGRIFSPGGLLDDFFQKNLQTIVDTTGPRWHWRPVGKTALGIPEEVLLDLQRAAVIRDSFFRGGHTPAIRFELKPVSIDRSLSQFALDIDGQQLSVTPSSPVRSVPMQWPGAGATSAVRVEYAPASPGGSTGFTVQGAWALFRLLDRATLTRTAQRERFTLSFDLDGRKVVLELLASSVLNPFQLDALTQFRCPATL